MNTNMESNGTVFADGHAGVLQAKIVTMVCLFSISMVVGCLPMVISLKYDWFTGGEDLRSSNRLIRGLLAFGGGVLFETTFMHLLPEVDENIQLLQEGAVNKINWGSFEYMTLHSNLANNEFSGPMGSERLLKEWGALSLVEGAWSRHDWSSGGMIF